MTQEIEESQINIIAEGTRISGEIRLDQITRIHGVLNGQIHGSTGSRIILAESGLIEGELDVDEILIEGFVRGNIRAKGKVFISKTGRVLGNVQTPSLQMEFGSHFDGKCFMENTNTRSSLTSSPTLSPV